MTTSDKRKAGLLVFLVIIGAAVYVWMYRPNSVASNSATAAKDAAKATPLKPGQGAQIRIDMLKGIASDEVGRKNLFQYRQKALPKPPEPIRPTTYVPPPPPVNVGPPPPPPPPPFKAFRYEGFSVLKDPGKNAKLLGSITESGTTYTVREGECLMGQYCISKLTENLVEIEDLQLKRKQTFTRAQ